MRGIFAIPPTPFAPGGALDVESLQSVVRFIVEAGAHGVVTPVNASEFPYLTDAERQQVVEITVTEVAGAIPVVVGITGTCKDHAAVFARHAREVGADAVIAMPPYVTQATQDQIVDYYKTLANESQLPFFIQNHMPPLGTSMSPSLVAQLVQDVEGVDYVKEECWPPGQFMSKEIELAGASLKGVMGGIGSRYLLDEYQRGACGTMPACAIADVHVQLWELLERGDTEGAETIFAAMRPMFIMEGMFGGAIYKEILFRRGVIASTSARRPGRPELDENDHRTLDGVLAGLEPYFMLKPPVTLAS